MAAYNASTSVPTYSAQLNQIPFAHLFFSIVPICLILLFNYYSHWFLYPRCEHYDQFRRCGIWRKEDRNIQHTKIEESQVVMVTEVQRERELHRMRSENPFLVFICFWITHTCEKMTQGQEKHHLKRWEETVLYIHTGLRKEPVLTN